MSKPVNVDAHRTIAIMEELQKKLEIVDLLKSEFFDELMKVDHQDMTQYFGDHIGQLLHFHAELEKSYKTHNVWPDGR